MLVRIFAMLLFDLAAFSARAQSLDQQLVGRWQAEGFRSMEMIFRADHTYIGRSDRYVSTGSWRVHVNSAHDPFLAHHPRVKRASTRVRLRFVEIDFSWDCTKPSRIHMDARSAKLSSGCKDSPTNVLDKAPVASNQAAGRRTDRLKDEL